MNVARTVPISLALLSVLAVMAAQPAACKSFVSVKQQVASKPTPSSESAIRARVDEINSAVNKLDAVTLANAFSTDGTFTDDDGTVFTGRTAIQDNFAKSFKEDSAPKVSLTVDRFRMAAPNVALVDGAINRVGEKEPTSHYSMVFVKQAGVWLISSAHTVEITSEPEAPQAKNDENPLTQLSWLVGNWTVEKNGATVTMKADWAPSKNFILCDFTVKKEGGTTTEHEMQVIGWDPRSQAPVSWSFDSAGGFGTGVWLYKDREWVVRSTSVERGGSTTSSTNICKPDANSFAWQSVDRIVDGVPVADTTPLRVEKATR